MTRTALPAVVRATSVPQPSALPRDFELRRMLSERLSIECCADAIDPHQIDGQVAVFARKRTCLAKQALSCFALQECTESDLALEKRNLQKLER